MEKQLLIWNDFMDDLSTRQMELISLDEKHYFKAAEIIKGYGHMNKIRTLDSLQLVAALDVSHARFLTADKFLSDLASRIGFTVEEV